VSDAQAAQLLGLPINQPDGVPGGWELVYHQVRYWADESPPIADYNRAWFRSPDMIGCEAASPICTDPPYVQVTVRHSTPEELRADPIQLPRLADFHLDDLTPVYGVLEGHHARLDWRADGRTYRLRASGIDADTALQIANSLA
jgi:hypothetical protein